MPFGSVLFGPKYQLGPSRFGPFHLGSPIRPIPFGPLGFVSLRRVTEFDMIDMIDDPNEVEQDVLEEIDPDLVPYTFSTRGGDQLIYLNKVYQIKKKLPTVAGLFRIQWRCKDEY